MTIEEQETNRYRFDPAGRFVIEGYDRAKPAAVDSLNAFLAEQLAPLDWFRAQPGDRLVALGGTVRNLARIHQAANSFPLDMVNGYELPASSVQEMAVPMMPNRAISVVLRNNVMNSTLVNASV